MISIQQLNGISFQVIHEAFTNAFADYVEPFDLTLGQLKYMVERRGCDLSLSVGAFDGDKLVGLTLNGVGNWNGRLTAYDTGTGVTKEYRKQGIATKMFAESLPILKEHSISQYLLEVICSNTNAYELYKKAGFKVTREFDYYTSPIDKLNLTDGKASDDIYVKDISNPDWDLLRTFWDFEPSWQNSIDSIMRKIDYFRILGVYKNENLAGYGIIEPATGDIPHLAVAEKFRRMGVAKLLFKNLTGLVTGNTIKIINIDAAYKPFKYFTKSIKLSPGIGQYEMMLEL